MTTTWTYDPKTTVDNPRYTEDALDERTDEGGEDRLLQTSDPIWTEDTKN